MPMTKEQIQKRKQEQMIEGYKMGKMMAQLMKKQKEQQNKKKQKIIHQIIKITLLKIKRLQLNLRKEEL